MLRGLNPLLVLGDVLGNPPSLSVAYAFLSPAQDHALVKPFPARFYFKSNPARPPALCARSPLGARRCLLSTFTGCPRGEILPRWDKRVTGRLTWWMSRGTVSNG